MNRREGRSKTRLSQPRAARDRAIRIRGRGRGQGEAAGVDQRPWGHVGGGRQGTWCVRWRGWRRRCSGSGCGVRTARDHDRWAVEPGSSTNHVRERWGTTVGHSGTHDGRLWSVDNRRILKTKVAPSKVNGWMAEQGQSGVVEAAAAENRGGDAGTSYRGGENAGLRLPQRETIRT
jgi:hypothetical protein